MKIDHLKWSAARRAVEASLREFKSRRGESLRPRWTCGADDRAFLALRREATLLYQVRAHLRRRIHTPGMTAEEQEKRVQASLALYVLSAPEVA
jgi:hypothetical protein